MVLDTIVCMFSEYCDEEPFHVEMCEVKTSSGEVNKYPDLKTRNEIVDVDRVNRKVGVSLSAESAARLLTKMSLTASFENDHLVVILFQSSDSNRFLDSLSPAFYQVQIPPTRQDVIHACDIYEDIAIANGLGIIPQPSLTTYTIGAQNPMNKLTELLRCELAMCGFTEVLGYVLCSKEDIGEKLRNSPIGSSVVTLANSKTKEFQVARTTLLPGLFKSLSANKHMQLPLKVSFFLVFILFNCFVFTFHRTC